MAHSNRNRLQLQIPQFIYNTEPTLVPGGGAEVIPLSNSNWFANNGFTNSYTQFQPPPPSANQLVDDYSQQEESTSAPFSFELPSQLQPGFEQSSTTVPPQLKTPDFSIFLAPKHPYQQGQSTLTDAPSVPVYSATGFDLLSILARVATRPNPKVSLGPVDLTCSFVVTDVRRFDHPIIYCSPNFTTLTGYSEAEVVGRNCRFLQSPDGVVRKGDIRTHTSHDAVSHMKRSLLADKECQTSIVNYKKDGTPFINLVTVIPLAGGVSNSPGEENDYVFQVGFQVDLTEQPNAILEKLRHGSYLVNYSSPADLTARQSSQLSSRERKVTAIPQVTMSKELKDLITDQAFLQSLPLSTATTVPLPAPSTTSGASQDDATIGGGNQPLHLLLLEASPDFVLVVSLKGSFLYIAPSVRRVLGFEPEEMVSGSLADYAHPEDIIPLMRELKESSATGGPVSESSGGNPSTSNITPRSVNLLFRARTKMGRYVWVECRGRLHVEPGKGRKAIVLTGRAREMANLKWEDVKSAGGLAKGIRLSIPGQERGKVAWRLVEQEVWGLLAGHGRDTMAFLSIGKGLEDVLGWKLDDLLGRSVMEVVVDEGAKTMLGGIVTNMRAFQRQKLVTSQQNSSDASRMRKVRCSLRKKDGSIVDVWFIIYRTDPNDDDDDDSTCDRSINELRGACLSISPAPLVYQIRLVETETIMPGSAGALPRLPLPSSAIISDPSLQSSEPSSSLAGATPISLQLPQPSNPLPAAPPTETLESSVPVEVFEELSTSRGSSWQYELQQLRFTNVRLREELATLELAEHGPLGEASSGTENPPEASAEQDTTYDYDEGYHDVLRPLYTNQQATGSSVGEIEPFVSPHSSTSFSHPPPSAQPGTRQQTNQSLGTSLPPNRPIQPRPPTQQPNWGTNVPMPVATTMNVSRNNGTSLKRPWGVNR
ncbi:hypothetical protein CPB83DRAFT_861770 [Crepidotus variabilis]|uniref:PAS domain-containing protein n=1 Tax=Crepidotus variabilis TaxID=179855 RepID=A0A9P6JKG2_9AGAR|nr:hypothetical protein CPB83DRAFT_861770 [Crepidotus variabilis]